MCLGLNKNSKIEVRGNDTVVYKVLRHENKEFVAPYRGTPYKRGEIKKERTFSDGDGNTFKQNLPLNLEGNGVFKGIHAYAEQPQYSQLFPDHIIVECTIPRGTPLIEGRFDSSQPIEVVALKLVVGKAVVPSSDIPLSEVNLFNQVDSFNRNIDSTTKQDTTITALKERLYNKLSRWLDSR